MTDPIRDTDTTSEHPQSIDPEVEAAREIVEEMEDDHPEATIKHAGGIAKVHNFEKLEERMDHTDPYPNLVDGEHIPVVRVWYSDEEEPRYIDYDYGTITEVNV